MIVVPARPDDVQIARLLALPGHQDVDGVDRRAVGVLGVRIGIHLVVDDVAVDEGHLRSGSDLKVFRAHAARRDGDRGAGNGRWSRRCPATAAAARHRQPRRACRETQPHP